MILVDINIFIDVLWAQSGAVGSAELIESVRSGKREGAVSALTIPVIWFLITKSKGNLQARLDALEITEGFHIVSLDSKIISKASISAIGDFEDAIQATSAIASKCDTIITRNKRDYGKVSGVRALTPEEFLAV